MDGVQSRSAVGGVPVAGHCQGRISDQIASRAAIGRPSFGFREASLVSGAKPRHSLFSKPPGEL